MNNNFSVANAYRCQSFGHHFYEWEPERWALAVSGEWGEFCNLLKKRIRGDEVSNKELEDELADVLTYIDLLASRMAISLPFALARKFNEVSERVNSDIRVKSSIAGDLSLENPAIASDAVAYLHGLNSKQPLDRSESERR